MKKIFTAAGLAFRIWFLATLFFSLGFIVYSFYTNSQVDSMMIFILPILCMGIGFPAFIGLFVFFLVSRVKVGLSVKLSLLYVFESVIACCYTVLITVLNSGFRDDNTLDLNLFMCLFVFSALAASFYTATVLMHNNIKRYYSGNAASLLFFDYFFNSFFHHKISTMETVNLIPQQEEQKQSNRLLVKGIVTAGLILLMLIPTLFIINLVTEREARQQEVVKEVSSKWSSSQTLSGPYLVVNQTVAGTDENNKPVKIIKQLILLADQLDVNGEMIPEKRQRSIYNVLLYKSDIGFRGTFKPKWPAGINVANIDFSNAVLCFGLSDFKGIEEELHINFNGQNLALNPGLPVHDLDSNGLSVPVTLTVDALDKGVPFDMHIKIKGSEKLHFMPLSANSKFTIRSVWPDPSFDGNILPGERQVTEKGFLAKWNFNQANLPFGTVLQQGNISVKPNLAFGVSMKQPADQYNKTMRCVKYAILFIGLTFSLFFIVEIMQKKPLHPVQYVLVGMALVIFFTLLLSISEYILFDRAYLIAASATIALITLYAKSHFNSWKTAMVFTAVLSGLYGFIFVLIRLEDTALIVGSIGLFIVLALVMYASRKINWYGQSEAQT